MGCWLTLTTCGAAARSEFGNGVGNGVGVVGTCDLNAGLARVVTGKQRIQES